MEPPPADVSSQVPGAAKDLKGASTGEPGSGTPEAVDGLLSNAEIKATEGVGGLLCNSEIKAAEGVGGLSGNSEIKAADPEGVGGVANGAEVALVKPSGIKGAVGAALDKGLIQDILLRRPDSFQLQETGCYSSTPYGLNPQPRTIPYICLFKSFPDDAPATCCRRLL